MKIELDIMANVGEIVYFVDNLKKCKVKYVDIQLGSEVVIKYTLEFLDGTSNIVMENKLLTKEKYKEELQRRLEDVK